MDGKVTVDFGPHVVPFREALAGAVVELARHEDGTVTAEIRIPGPPVP